MNHLRRFSGIVRLYGEAAFQKIQQAQVCVVGLGGVGSWVVEALARSGVGKLILIDLDNVAESNVNRQLQALTAEFGKPKVEVLKQRILQINPHCEVVCIEDFVDAENITILFQQTYSFVIDAIDQMNIKVLMANYFIKNKQAFAVSGAAGGQKEVAKIRRADLSRVTHDKLLANMRYRLRKHYGFAKEMKKMHIDCVYSTENVIFPQQQGCDNSELQGLSCAGFGASMTVTAAFAMHLAEIALESIITNG